MRIGGLASGMDIDSLVSELMKAERIPLDKLNQKKQTLEWQRDEYRDMNKLLDEFDRFIMDNMTLKSSVLKKKVTSTNTASVTATANSSAGSMNASITVNSTAKSATWISGKELTYTPPTDDMEIELEVTNGDGALATIKNSDGTTSNVIKITIKAGATIDEVLTQLSNKKELGISTFSESGQVAITKNDTGALSAIKLVDADAQNLFRELGFELDGSNNLTFDTTLGAKQGENANFTINGLNVTSKASNTFTINNVNYTLHSPGTSNVSVASDSDSMFNNITTFVNKYNELLEKINGKISEERYRDYLPLTDEEKEAMSEKQIEQWEERAKSGLIKNDSLLSGALSKLRTDFYNPVTSTTINPSYSQITHIGIKTSSNYLDKGKLLIDETKLREAIEKDPEAVFELFNSSGSTTSEKGLTKRLRETISTTINNIELKAGKASFTNQQYTIGRNLTQVYSQIDRFEDRLLLLEDRYWSQFTAMEKAIQQSNSQMSYLMQQFSM
ncbi:flagellar hook-associated protein 2 [Metabacillus sp. HB246100]